MDTIKQIPVWLLRRPLWLFVAWALWLSLEYWGLGDFSYLHIHDNADQIIPVSTWLTESPHRLFSTTLLPEMCGVDRFATTAWINLHRLFCLVMPAWLAHGLFIFVQRFVAGYFTCRLLKEGFGVAPAVSILAGFAYTLINLEHGEMRLMHNLNEPGFPLMIWMLFRLPINKMGLALLAAIGGGVFFSLTMGPVGAWPFLFPSAVLCALILRSDLNSKAAVGKFIGLIVVFGIGCLSLRIPSLMAMVPNGALSHRADWTAYKTFYAQWRHLMSTRVGLLLPWWGAIAFAACWVFKLRGRGRRDVATLCLLLIGLFAGPFLQSLAVTFKDAIGFLGGFNFTRFDRVLPFALLLAAALGINRFQHVILTERWLQVRISTLLALALLGMTMEHSLADKRKHLSEVKQEGKSWRTLYENAEVKALAAATRDEQFRTVTAGTYHAFHPLYALPQGLELADGYVVMYPNHYQKYWAEVVRPITEKEPEYFLGHFGWWGSRVYLFHSSRKEHQFIAKVPFADWYNLNLLSLANVKYVISKKPIDDERLTLRPPVITEEVREAWWNLPAKDKAQGYLRGENPGAPMYIYENEAAVPRFFVAGNAQWFDEEDALFEHLRTNSLPDLVEEVYLLSEQRDSPAELDFSNAETDATLSWTKSQTLSVQTVGIRATKPSWLVFSSLYYPWWTCTINGEATRVYRAYGAFMAVRVPAGDHKVRFSYEPPYGIVN